MARGRDLHVRIFVGERRIEELTPGELEKFAAQTAARMGEKFNAHFAQHIEEYQKIPELQVPEMA